MTDFIELSRIVFEWIDESSLNKDDELASWLDDTQRLRRRYMVRHRFNVSNLIFKTNELSLKRCTHYNKRLTMHIYFLILTLIISTIPISSNDSYNVL